MVGVRVSIHRDREARVKDGMRVGLGQGEVKLWSSLWLGLGLG